MIICLNVHRQDIFLIFSDNQVIADKVAYGINSIDTNKYEEVSMSACVNVGIP